ncbi:hypothetical protein [Tahibacter sp.]|uniref:hypothetical protein n=1 Tax=Tahibacter sp. TaxID=2056211 RepID=UPI0028C48C85|nr:hypothetical protein [Tahibacter sp.]
MESLARTREKIYEYFHSSEGCQSYFYAQENEPSFVAYYNSMYLLQDATESLAAHRTRGFAEDARAAYLEFWGVMQAIVIQQDAICELHEVVAGEELNARRSQLKAWLELRDLRNLCAGHPVKKDIPRREPLTRTFMSRSFGNYSAITFEQWRQGEGESHPKVNLAELLDEYEVEANAKLEDVLAAMRRRWSRCRLIRRSSRPAPKAPLAAQSPVPCCSGRPVGLAHTVGSAQTLASGGALVDIRKDSEDAMGSCSESLRDLQTRARHGRHRDG